MALFEAQSITCWFPRPHEAYGLCALGFPQFKADGLVVVFDHIGPTFYRVSPNVSIVYLA